MGVRQLKSGVQFAKRLHAICMLCVSNLLPTSNTVQKKENVNLARSPSKLEFGGIIKPFLK